MQVSCEEVSDMNKSGYECETVPLILFIFFEILCSLEQRIGLFTEIRP